MNSKSGYATVNGVGFKFGMNAFLIFCEAQGIEFSKLGDALDEKKIDLLVMRNLYWSAAAAHARSTGKPEPTPHEIGDLLDEISEEDFEALNEALNGAKIMGKTMRELAKETSQPPAK